MPTEYLRNQQYEAQQWEDTIKDEQGNIIIQGTPVNERTLNNIETGVLLSHYDVGLLAAMAMQFANANQLEIEKFKKQRTLQGNATISNTIVNDGYFRSSEPFVEVALEGFAQINAPNYDVLITVTSSDDNGSVGDLIVYDKTQNGFKVKMTGSAETVSFLWTLLNPNV